MNSKKTDESSTFDIEAVRKLLNENDVFCTLDIETTGLDKDKDEVLEIYIDKMSINGDVIDTFHQFCRPMSGFISAGVTKIHSITIDYVAGMPNYFSDGINKQVEDFMRGCVIVGQNIKRFDLPFIRVTSDKIFDTMEWGKYLFPGGRVNNRSLAEKFKIKYDPSLAHGAKYDAHDLTRWVFVKMARKLCPNELNFGDIEEIAEVVSEEETIATIVDDDGEGQVELVVHSIPRINLSVEQISDYVKKQAYSYSRLTSYIQCPYKWYLSYIEGYKGVQQAHFMIGHVCHSFAELAGGWCYKQTMAARASMLEEDFLKKLNPLPSLMQKMELRGLQYNVGNMIRFFIDCPLSPEFDCDGDFKRVSQILNYVNSATSDDDLQTTSFSYPDTISEEQIFNKALIKNNCNEPQIINDSRYIIRQFGRTWKFETGDRSLIMQEKKLCFDKDWNPLTDFFSKDAYFRLVMDFIQFGSDYIIVRDYKTNRVVPSQAELEEDFQLSCYILGLLTMVPRIANSDTKVIAENAYLRHGVSVQIDVLNATATAERAKAWISETVSEINDEIKKPIELMFQPCRNEYCGNCEFQSSRCPLFNRKLNNTILDVDNFDINNAEDCARAWKQAESYKATAKALSSKVRTWLASNDSMVVDSTAILDIYQDKERKVDTLEAYRYLSGLSLETLPGEKIVEDMTFGADKMVRLLKRNRLELDDETRAKIFFEKPKNKLACRVNKLGDEGEEDE